MKNYLKQSIQTALEELLQEDILVLDEIPDVQIQYSKNKQNGDFASNIAMMLAKPTKKSAVEIAHLIVSRLHLSSHIVRIEVAPRGFINFFLSHDTFQPFISEILTQKFKFGESMLGQGNEVHMEIVSANPTGPLHVGHGRLAAFDSSLANLLMTLGYKVHCEYYVNDAGRQMYILALSIWLRYLELCNQILPFPFPEQAYQGDYVIKIAQAIKAERQNDFSVSQSMLAEWELKDLTDPDRIVDDLVEHMKACLGASAFDFIFQKGLTCVLAGIQKDLSDFRVNISQWFCESELWKKKEIEESIRVLEQSGYIYEKEGAKWFEAMQFGDEKDRVVVRKNGQYTYFAADIAYHWDKFKRGFNMLLDTFGSDHHGYTKRIKGVAKAFGKNPDQITCFLIQFAILYKAGEKLSMSTRKGVFVTLRELYEEVGVDAARFFYVMRRHDQHLDFDLDLAKARSNENPVYYIQYAHARICSVFRQLPEKRMQWDQENGLKHLDKLDTEQEKTLIRCMFRYQDTLKTAAQNFEPQVLACFLHELANCFHSYYNAYQFLVEDIDLKDARLSLILAARYIIANGLKILGVNAPHIM